MDATKKKEKKEKKKEKKSKKVKKVVKKKATVNKHKIERNYSEEALAKAIHAVTKKGFSFKKAAQAYEIPQTTLFRMCSNPERNCRKGPATVLSQKEEEEVANWIMYRADRGFPITKSDLLDSVQHYLTSLERQTPFKNKRPGRHWFEGFLRRHPTIARRVPQHLSAVRASVTQEDLREWFDGVQTYLCTKNLINIHPSRVFNCDETNIQLCPKSEKVLTGKGTRAVYKVVDAFEKESITTIFMYSAEGTRAPPMVLYPYKQTLPKIIIQNSPKGWGIGMSDNGWMTIETFYEYITNVFYQWLLQEKFEFPVIIYLDGHSSHVTIPLVSFCRQKQIELILLYPNATHILQPLDIAFFHPLKEIWKKTVPKWKMENDMSRLKKEQFALVLKMALDSMSEEKNVIQSGFRASGLMPFNPDIVQYDILNKKKKKNNITENDKPIENQIVNNKNEERKCYLKEFEDTLPSQVLEDFKAAESSGVWLDDIEKKGLFEYWLGIKNASDRSIVKPKIKSIEYLENHSVVVLAEVPCDSSEQVITIEDNILSLSSNNLLSNDIEIIDVSNEADQSLSDFSLNTSSLAEEVTYSGDSTREDQTKENISPNNSVTPEANKLIVESSDVASKQNEIENFKACDKENENQEKNKISKTFDEAFTLPMKYLPKKKRQKLEAKGIAKKPVAGTDDVWWEQQMKKEKEQEIKEEKAAKKRKLQEEKKKIAEEKKKLQEKIKEIQRKIKTEI